MSPQDKSIFISRAESDVPDLLRLTQEKNVKLLAKSLIDFEPVDFKILESHDVVFFSSPRAFQFYLHNGNDLHNQTIAVVGKATARTIQKEGYSIGFIGDDKKSVSENASKFKAWLADRTVLFPISNRSLRSFSKLLPKNQKDEVIVYNTILRNLDVPECNVYIFSSPSSAEAFLNMNSIPPKAIVVAWGESTQKALSSRGIDALIPEEPSEQAIIQLLRSLSIL